MKKEVEEIKMIAKFDGLKIATDGISWFDSDFKSLKKYNKSWDALMPILEKIHSPMRVKLYGAYRKIGGEEYNVLIHRGSQTGRYITLKIEYGRRFKEFTEYRQEGETMLEPTYRFVVKFIKWYNEHQ